MGEGGVLELVMCSVPAPRADAESEPAWVVDKLPEAEDEVDQGQLNPVIERTGAPPPLIPARGNPAQAQGWQLPLGKVGKAALLFFAFLCTPVHAQAQQRQTR